MKNTNKQTSPQNSHHKDGKEEKGETFATQGANGRSFGDSTPKSTTLNTWKGFEKSKEDVGEHRKKGGRDRVKAKGWYRRKG